MTDVWQPGKTYIPGSIVKPTSTPTPGVTPLNNPGFEAGTLAGWTAVSGSWTVGGSPYSGSYKVTVAGNGTWVLQNTASSPVTPGQTINASGFARLTNSGTDDQGAEVALYWYDASHTFISQSEGRALTGAGGSWHPINVTGVAPANAAFVQLVLGAHVTSGGNIDFDAFSWSNGFSGPPAGLVYKATQAGPGVSAASEPAWPGNTTTPVTDNTVTWQGVIASQIVWVAIPINKSGATEPDWPLVPGASVHDGSIDWTASSKAVADVNCPHSAVVAIAASKIYAADNDIIRYSATVNPLDWTATNDAGYLPFGLNTFGSNPAAAMSLYRSNLVVFNSEGFQMWQVDEDPANTSLLDALPIASTWNTALTPVANDLLFLSSRGVRSVGVAATGVSLGTNDVGMPIDALVKPAMDQAIADGANVTSTYIPSLGQYWLAFTGYPTTGISVTGDIQDSSVGVPVVGAYVASGGLSPYVFTVGSGTFPPGITLNANGTYSGTFTEQGVFSWVIHVVDGYNNAVDLPDTCTIGSNFQLIGTLPDGASGTPYSGHFTASGGTPPYAGWAISSGTLPPGLSIDPATGIISGTPT